MNSCGVPTDSHAVAVNVLIPIVTMLAFYVNMLSNYANRGGLYDLAFLLAVILDICLMFGCSTTKIGLIVVTT